MRPQPIDVRPQDLPTKASLPRLRVEYGKDERLAFLGHLELVNTIGRCVRRSRLPFSLGNGFARRMRIQFSQALPVGASSACEYFDLSLTERVEAGRALEALAAATPPALAPVRCGYVEGPQAALEAWLTRAAWDVALVGCPLSAGALGESIGRVRERGHIAYLRGDKEKVVDVASALVGFAVRAGGGGELLLALETRSSNAGALRPHVLVDAALAEAGAPGACDAVRVRRTGQWHEAEDGRLVKPL